MTRNRIWWLASRAGRSDLGSRGGGRAGRGRGRADDAGEDAAQRGRDRRAAVHGDQRQGGRQTGRAGARLVGAALVLGGFPGALRGLLLRARSRRRADGRPTARSLSAAARDGFPDQRLRAGGAAVRHRRRRQPERQPDLRRKPRLGQGPDPDRSRLPRAPAVSARRPASARQPALRRRGPDAQSRSSGRTGATSCSGTTTSTWRASTSGTRPSPAKRSTSSRTRASSSTTRTRARRIPACIAAQLGASVQVNDRLTIGARRQLLPVPVARRGVRRARRGQQQRAERDHGRRQHPRRAHRQRDRGAGGHPRDGGLPALHLLRGLARHDLRELLGQSERRGLRPVPPGREGADRLGGGRRVRRQEALRAARHRLRPPRGECVSLDVRRERPLRRTDQPRGVGGLRLARDLQEHRPEPDGVPRRCHRKGLAGLRRFGSGSGARCGSRPTCW